MLVLHTPSFENIFKRLTVSEGCAFGPSYRETQSVMTADLQVEWHILIRTIKQISFAFSVLPIFMSLVKLRGFIPPGDLGTYAVVQSQEREQDPIAQEFLKVSTHAHGFMSFHFILRPSKLSFQTLLVLPP